MGPSGSGKSTLLHLLAGFYGPTRGTVTCQGVVLRSKDEATTKWRSRNVGFVFQSMNLLPDFSVAHNLLIAGELAGMEASHIKKRSAELLERLGVADKAHRRPGRLSLGEQQRVALARALLHGPSLVLVDEPMASLDSVNASLVLDCLTELCHQQKTTLVVATHDEAVASRLSKRIRLSQEEWS